MKVNRDVLAGGLVASVLLTGCTTTQAENSITATETPRNETNPSHPQHEKVKPPAIQDSPTGHMWVDTARMDEGNQCYIDMRHILDGYVVVESLARTGGTPCDVGDQILKTSLPENYNDILEEKRAEWNRFIESVGKEAEDEEINPDAGIYDGSLISGGPFAEITYPGWVDVVGRAPDSASPHYFNGLDPRPDDIDDRVYGTESCILDSNAYARKLGSVSYWGESYDLLYLREAEDNNGTLCDFGDILLVPIKPFNDQDESQPPSASTDTSV